MSWLTTDPVALWLALMFFAFFAGVILPAVWSSRPTRRQAAAAVLAQLLTVLRRR
ncbi:hypothetical protein [Streptomyces spiramyceticus]|uniref:hypothetical protein n=1 Tax=Streptomyces spiramyceticus TaxID=299717 RepID=UPI00237A2595|nr:hypothetical protein [Streptomyces spiramyceticus]